MKLFLRFALVVMIGLMSQSAKGQFVTIPDPNFVTWLQNNGYAGCMNGNQLDATCPAVLNAFYLDCSFQNITDLTGLEAFVGLQVLYCNDNQLTILPTLTNSVETLRCNNNQIIALSNLPSSITQLYCSNNQLTFLPALPTSLEQLRCQDNSLTSLPTLPSSLEELYCFHNQLTNLPTLPASLMILYCNNNQLTALPTLSASLTTLYCNNNQLTALPALPTWLYLLACDANQITALPNLPSSLNKFSCFNNQLTVLPALPMSLTEFFCSGNQLSDLPSLPNELFGLDISNNPNITCLPTFEKFTGPDSWFSIANTGITCLPNIIQHSGYIAAIDTMPLCGIFNSSGCDVFWNIEGNAYHDNNSNCAFDNTELNLSNIKFQLSQGGNVQQQVYSNGAGNYSFDTNLGSYNTRVDTTGLPFSVTCPATNSHTSTLIVTDSLDYNADFALECKPGYDVAVQSIWSGMFFPVHQATVSIQAGDLVQYYGTTCNTAGLSGTVTANYSGPVSISSVSGNGLVAGNTVTWNVNDFSQLDFFNDFSITFLTDTFPPQGSQVCIDVNITASTGTDNNLSNNSLTQCFNVVNSFDPNFKEVYPSSVVNPGDWHTYTVHFQNTGTAAAQHVQVIDTLDSNLDWSSFQLLAYSHNNLTQVLNNGIVHFNFPNINLPDSTSDEPNSHGWIQYRIKTDSTITSGTIIHNTANIYFDFNAPVVTNDAVVNYCLPVTFTQTLEICNGDSVQIGNDWYHQPGEYATLLQTSLGCDSVVLTELVVEYVDTAVTQIGTTLTATSNASSYQWIDCNTNQPITGATNSTFTATSNGSYAVQITSTDNCVETSSCILVNSIGISTVNQSSYSLFPNPANQTVTLMYPNEIKNGLVAITDLTGRTVFTQPLSNKNSTQLDLQMISSGAYWISVLVNDKTASVQKLIVLR